MDILRKEDTTMNQYSKPEIRLVGDATSVIQNQQKGEPNRDSNGTHAVVPAYDLDE